MAWVKDKVNYYCIMSEGIFNLMGEDLLGLTSIVPLFLIEYGASTGTVGMVMTAQGLSLAVVPLIVGGFVSRTVSKRRLAIIVNSLGRGSMLIMPIILIGYFPENVIVSVFLLLLLIRFLGAPIQGLTWQYLLSDCIKIEVRPKLLGILLAISGFVSFASSYYIKLIRDSKSLASDMKYFYIFGAAAIAMTLSIACFIPLKENIRQKKINDKFTMKEYLLSLFGCYKVKDYTRLLQARFFSFASLTLNAFLFIYANSSLKLPSHFISNLIIFQTIGIIIGGIVTGQISARFGVKRMLLLVEISGLFIPILALSCMIVKTPYILISLCIFMNGFNRSGQLGYANYIMEIVDKERVILHSVARGLVLLPLSFLSTLAGLYIQNHSMTVIFVFQIVASALAVTMCTRLRLVKRNVVEKSLCMT